MAIKKITVSNFRSFGEQSLNLGKFSILIGANASGKSNFVQIFQFLKDLAKFGLDNAISRQGGLEYLVNANMKPSQEFSIEIVSDTREEYVLAAGGGPSIVGVETTYKFALKTTERKNRFEIIEDKLSQKCKFGNVVAYTRALKVKEDEKLGNGSISLLRINGKPEFQLVTPKGVKIEEDAILPIFVTKASCETTKSSSKNLLITAAHFPFSVGGQLRNSLQDIAVYDFDPNLAKKAQPFTGPVQLKEDGSNLAIVINNLLKSKIKKRQLYNLISGLLPFVDELRTQRFGDTVLFKLRERYSENQFFPSFLVSDGTINLTALIIALFFEGKALTIIEEPERNIHPYLISKMIEMMREASQKTQIITTTHNPEVVRHAHPDEILLLSRTREGYSQISKPAEKEEIKIFLENEMGIEELYVQNLLEV